MSTGLLRSGLLLFLDTLPNVEIPGTFDYLVIVDECLSESFAKYHSFVIEVTDYREWLLTFCQQPPPDTALPKIRNPSCRAIDPDLPDLHQPLGVEQGW